MVADFALGPHPTIPKGLPVCVAIIDGYGENEYKDEFNAVHSAKTPCFDRLRSDASRFRTVAAHGPAVGLPSMDDMGNSEVGHNAFGAGKIYAQGAKLVDLNLKSGQLFQVCRAPRPPPHPRTSLTLATTTHRTRAGATSSPRSPRAPSTSSASSPLAAFTRGTTS